jgi:lipopolysaccharide/colanic/teichoic acid biosynthesis glycosyltransferase
MEHSGDSRAVASAPTSATQVANSAQQVDGATTNGHRGSIALELPDQFVAPPARSPAKRALDLALCVAIGVVALPLCLLIALTIKVTSGGPVLFRQKRPGLGGSTIEMLKFRTMHVDAEQRLLDDPLLHERFVRSGYKLQDDPRLTRMGRLLRKLSLDELPQILNVLGGSMSWVGPRPILLEELAQDIDMTAYFSVRPGITGLWQVSGRSNADKPTLWRAYVEDWSFWLDLKIILRTPIAVITGQGAF